MENRNVAQLMVRWFGKHKASYTWQEMEDAFTEILDETCMVQNEELFLAKAEAKRIERKSW